MDTLFTHTLEIAMQKRMKYATAALAAILVASSADARLTTRGYELESITSSGTQYIDTGIKPNKNIRTVVDIAILVASANQAVFGVENSTISYSLYRNTASPAYWGYSHNDGNGSWSSSGYLADTARHVFDFNHYIAASNKYYLVYDGQEPYKALANSISKTATYSLYLGGRRRAAGAPSYYSTHQIWSCQMYDGENLVRDFVPWKVANGKIGLWDLVENAFHGSLASANYAGGSIVTNRVYFFSEWEDKCSSTPAFGQGPHLYNHGDTVTATFSASLDANDIYDDGIDHLHFAGWRLWRNGEIVATGPEKTASFTHDASSYEELEWYFDTSFHMYFPTEGPGTVSSNHVLATEGDTVSIMAIPNPGMAFLRWKGDLKKGQDQLANPLQTTADCSRTYTAEFYNPATEPRVYFEAVDANDNKQWLNTRYNATPKGYVRFDGQYLQTQGQAMLIGNAGPLYWRLYQKNDGGVGSTDNLRYCLQTSTTGIDSGKKTDTNRHVFRINYYVGPNTRGFRMDNVDGTAFSTEKTVSLQTVSATTPLCVGTASKTASSRSRHRIYSLTIYDNAGETLPDPVRDFVPAAMRGLTGLWERVEGRFYPSDAYADGYVGGGYVGYNPLTNHLEVVSVEDWVEVTPAFGRHVCTNGDTIAYSAPAVVTNGTQAAICTGWKRYVNEVLVEEGSGHAFTREKVWGMERVEWLFTSAYQVEVVAGEGGSVETTGTGEWYATGTTNAITAVATNAEGYAFLCWSGDLPDGTDIRVPSLSFQATAATTIRAFFEKLDGENEVTVFEYVQSTDDRQYINTGYLVTPTTWAVFDAQYMMTKGQARLFGNNGPLYWSLYQKNTGGLGSTDDLRYWFNTSSSGYADTGKKTDTARHVFLCSYKVSDTTRGFQMYNVDGTAFSAQKTWSLQTRPASTPLFIGTYGAGNAVSRHRIYGLTLYEDGSDQPVRDFLPAAMGGATGLWDRVEHKFYTSGAGGNYTTDAAPVTDRLTVRSRWGDWIEASPACGPTNGIAAGTTLSCTASAAVTNDTTAIVCSGYALRRNGLTIATGAGNAATFQHTASFEELEWLYDVFHRIDIMAGEGGAVSTAGGWMAEGATVTATATPTHGYMFYRWTGDIPDGADANSPSITLPADGPRAVTATFSFATASGVKLYTGANYGDWDTASNWTPEGVPTSTDEVYIPASSSVRIALTADVFSLTVSNAALVNVNGPASKPSSVSGQTAGNTATNGPVGLTVRGDLLLLGSSKLGLGGKNQHSHPYLAVGGDFTMEGSSAFAIHAGPADETHDYTTGGAKVSVGGTMTLGSACAIYPWSHFTTASKTTHELSTGLGVVFDLHGFVIEEGGNIVGYAKGFPRYYRLDGILQDPGNDRKGGSHGGRGGAISASGSRYAVIGRPYAPVHPGKPGGNAQTDGSGRTGGAAIRVTATDVRLDGTITVEGAGAEGGGGGAGGSVFLLCDDLQFGPASIISAAGRYAGENSTPSGGGGGGRVAIALGLTQAQSASLLADGELPSGVTAREALPLVPDGRLSVRGANGNQAYDAWDDGEDGTAYYVVNGALASLAVATAPATRAAIAPSAGLHAYAPGTAVSATAPEFADISLDPKIRYAPTSASSPAAATESAGRRICVGWTLMDGNGATVASGDTTNATFTIGSGAYTLTWNYGVRENRLDASATEGGTVSYAQVWAASNGSFPVLTATPADEDHVFAYWAGDVDATNRFDNPLTLPADKARAVLAVFASATPTTYTWNKFKDSTTYSWHDAASWTPRGVPGPNDTAIISRPSSTQANAQINTYACVSNLVVRGAKAYLRVGCTTSSYGNDTISNHSALTTTSPIGLDVRGDLAATNAALVIVGGELLAKPAYVNIGGDLIVGGGDGRTRFVIFGCNTNAVADARFGGTSRLVVEGTTTVLNLGELFAPEHYKTDGYPFLSLGDLVVEEGGAVCAYNMGVRNYVTNTTEYNYPWPTRQQNAENSYFGGSHGGRGGKTSKSSGEMQYIGTVYGCTNTPVHSGMQGGNSGVRPGGVVRIDARTVFLAGTMTAHSPDAGSNGGSAGGSVWVTCSNFTAAATAVIDVHGGSPTRDSSGGGGGGRASVCVGLTDEQLVALRDSDDVAGVLITPLADVVSGFNAAGGDCGGWSGSSGEDGTGVYIVHVGEGVSLTTSGEPVAAGLVTPAYGITAQTGGEAFAIEAPEVADVLDTDGRSRYLCGGYLVTNAAGTVLASGAGNAGTVTLDEDAFLTWYWTNVEHRVAITASEGGTIVTNAIGDASSEWQLEGTRISVTAVPDAGQVFLGWIGDAQGLDRTSATIEFGPDQARDLTARFATASAGVKTWVGGTGDWMDDGGWDPYGVPGPATETHVPSGAVLLDGGFPVPLGSLTIYGGARVNVSSTGTDDMSPPTDGDCATDTIGFRVAGNLDLRGTLYVGGWNQLRTGVLTVGGDLVLTNGATLTMFAGCRDNWGDPEMFRQGGATVSVAGLTRIRSGSTLTPICASLSGAPVVFHLHDLLLEEGGRIYAAYGGYYVYTSTGELFGYAPGTPQTRTAFKASPYCGGSYGGKGAGTRATDPYCTDFAPYQPGSPGANVEKSRAGGAVRIDCSGKAEIHGEINVNGAAATAKSQGGRSGGAIWITARRIVSSPTALLTAKGGNQYNDANSMGAGGGRICLAKGLSEEQIAALYTATELPRHIEKTDLLTESVPEWQGTVNVAGGSNASRPANDGNPGTAVFVRAPIPPTMLLLR